MNIIFLDTETTDLDNPRLVQLAYKNAATGVVVNEYFKPPVPISYGAMAVHHITNEMVADKILFQGSKYQSELLELAKDNIVVAHNVAFDLFTLKNENVDVVSSIDTLLAAQHLLNSDSYSLQYLRYSLGLNVAGAAHDALGDVLVLETLFNYLVNLAKNKFGLSSDEQLLQKMIELTNTPISVDVFKFGKYKGRLIKEINEENQSYLDWLYKSEMEKDEFKQNKGLLCTLDYYLHKNTPTN